MEDHNGETIKVGDTVIVVDDSDGACDVDPETFSSKELRVGDKVKIRRLAKDADGRAYLVNESEYYLYCKNVALNPKKNHLKEISKILCKTKYYDRNGSEVRVGDKVSIVDDSDRGYRCEGKEIIHLNKGDITDIAEITSDQIFCNSWGAVFYLKHVALLFRKDEEDEEDDLDYELEDAPFQLGETVALRADLRSCSPPRTHVVTSIWRKGIWLFNGETEHGLVADEWISYRC